MCSAVRGILTRAQTFYSVGISSLAEDILVLNGMARAEATLQLSWLVLSGLTEALLLVPFGNLAVSICRLRPNHFHISHFLLFLSSQLPGYNTMLLLFLAHVAHENFEEVTSCLIQKAKAIFSQNLLHH